MNNLPKFYGDQFTFRKADAIICGFDTWHCLIFAPFNKRMILNSAYRFDGHIVKPHNYSAELQQELYDIVTYNPDVLLAGTNLYDVMYHQHFLGSLKIIPLPAVGDYVRDRLMIEKMYKRCDCFRWNSQSNQILLAPRRLSQGARKVIELIRLEAFKHHPFPYKLISLEETIAERGNYKYCDLLKYRALILLPYSVHSYFR